MVYIFQILAFIYSMVDFNPIPISMKDNLFYFIDFNSSNCVVLQNKMKQMILD